MSADFACLHDVVAAAHRQMSGTAWDYVAGAALTETTLRRNRYALDSYAFLPRVLRDVSKIDTSGSAFGHRLRIPVVMAPMGSMGLMTRDGAKASARAAGEFGTMQVVSSVNGFELEDVAAAGTGAKVFQLYIRGDLDWIKSHLDRARAAGYAALMLTVDGPYYGLRERQLMHRWTLPSVADKRRHFQAAVTWDLLRDIRKAWGGPMVVKGIATGADTKLAVEHGIDVVCASNHGGRELDHGRGTLDMLPEIVDVAGRNADVWVDGGFVRGTDVVKALCLGAKAVGVGRLQAWGLAAGGTSGGAEGLLRTLELLEEEIFNCMGLIGATSVAELGPHYLSKVTPLAPTHETSAFRHLGPEPLR